MESQGIQKKTRRNTNNNQQDAASAVKVSRACRIPTGLPAFLRSTVSRAYLVLEFERELECVSNLKENYEVSANWISLCVFSNSIGDFAPSH
jgi:hypothetical protein